MIADSALVQRALQVASCNYRSVACPEAAEKVAQKKNPLCPYPATAAAFQKSRCRFTSNRYDLELTLRGAIIKREITPNNYNL